MVVDVDKNGIPDVLQKNGPLNNTGSTGTGFSASFLPIYAPDEDVPDSMRYFSPEQFVNWFTFVAPKGKKGGAKSTYYNNVTDLMNRLGIPKDKHADAIKDAVAWAQTKGSVPISGAGGQATADPADFFLGFVDVARYGSGADSGYGTTKSKQKTATKYSESQAAADLRQAYKSELGIGTTEADIAAYQKAVNAAAAKEPAIYSSSTTVSPGKGGVKAISTTEGVSETGFNPSEFAIKFARSNPDYAENFAIKNFMGLIEQSLTDPTRVGQVIE